jgi:hypothetical protein
MQNIAMGAKKVFAYSRFFAYIRFAYTRILLYHKLTFARLSFFSCRKNSYNNHFPVPLAMAVLMSMIVLLSIIAGALPRSGNSKLGTFFNL